MFKNTIIFVIVLFLSVITNAQTNNIPFAFFETSEELSIDDVITIHSRFESDNTIEKTLPSKTYWIRLDFKGQEHILQEKDNWFLRFKNFDFATLYFRDSENIQSYTFGEFDDHQRINTAIQSKNWFFPFKSTNLIQNRYLFLKVRRVATFEFIKNWKFRFVTKEKKELIADFYSQRNLKFLIPTYIFTGICLIIFIITLVSFFLLKKYEFLFYALYALSLFLYLCSYSFNLHKLIFGEFKITGYWFFQIMQVVINLCYILFVIYYLNTKKNYPKLHLALKLIVILLCTVIVIDTLSFITGYYVWHIHILNFQRYFMSAFGILAMIYLLVKAKDKLAYFVVFGSFLFMIGALGFLFLHHSIYMIIGASFEIAIFGLGLIYKIQQGYEQKLHFEKESNANMSKALRAQINPHFIFNSLSSIQHLVTKNDRVSAIKYLSKFSRLTRNVLESSFETSTLLSDEIKMLNDYLELESLRFDNAFKYKITTEDDLDSNALEIPSMLLQPFVENAIIHGLLPKVKHNKDLAINFKINNDVLICEVDDNGIGRDAASKKEHIHKRKKKSRGLEVTQQRLETLTGNKDNIKIIDKKDESGNALGTKVIIKIPV